MIGEVEGEPSDSSFKPGGVGFGFGLPPLVLRKNEGKDGADSLVERKKDENEDAEGGERGVLTLFGTALGEVSVAVGGKVSAARGESLSGSLVSVNTDSEGAILEVSAGGDGREKKLLFFDDRKEPTLVAR